jgi:hypothetical protein
VVGKTGQGFFKLVLHGFPGRLALPALVMAAVVADTQGDTESCGRLTFHP